MFTVYWWSKAIFGNEIPRWCTSTAVGPRCALGLVSGKCIAMTHRKMNKACNFQDGPISILHHWWKHPSSSKPSNRTRIASKKQSEFFLLVWEIGSSRFVETVYAQMIFNKLSIQNFPVLLQETIRSSIEYCQQPWHPRLKIDDNILERAQRIGVQHLFWNTATILLVLQTRLGYLIAVNRILYGYFLACLKIWFQPGLTGRQDTIWSSSKLGVRTRRSRWDHQSGRSINRTDCNPLCWLHRPPKWFKTLRLPLGRQIASCLG